LPVQYVIRTGASYAELGEVAARFVAEAQKVPGLIDVDGEIRLSTPRLEVTLDRERIADAGVDVDVVGRTLESLLAGRQVTRFNLNAEQYDVIVQLEDGDRRSADDLAAIYVRGRDGVMLQLGNLVSVKETVAAQEYPRFNQQRSVIVSAGLAPGTSLGDALDELDQIARRVLPPGYQTDVAGQSREFRQSATSIAVIFALALMFIALLLAAQFESVIAPVVILVTVPLSMAGALLALFLVGGSLNVYSQIGLVTLIGLITKHGILMVEFANHAFAAGKSRAEAIVEAAGLRLRPILMTTAAMVLGAVPLAIATGAGAESRQQIGWVIVGGMTVGTILTLFVLPTVYAMLPERRAARVAAPAPAE
jgi:multidrug efflux pump